LLDTYKTQVEEMDRDTKEREEKLVEGAGFVKQSVLDETNEHNEKLAAGELDDALIVLMLTADIANLEATIAELTSANATLDAEVNDLMRRVVSGEYNPERERCLELRLNPAAKIKAIRNEELEKLKKENEALLDQLSASGGGAGGVPIESFERLRSEKEDLERSHAKRLQRLKEVSSRSPACGTSS
jgi:mitotic spindle assembly checkpoint protein MAD1